MIYSRFIGKNLFFFLEMSRKIRNSTGKPYPSLSKDLKDQYTRQMLLCSIHGLKNILSREPSKLKKFWCIILVISFNLCVLFIGLNLLGYFNYDVVANIDNEIEYEAEFPQITICNLKYFTCLFDGKPCGNSVVKIDNCIEFNSGKNSSDYPTEIFKSHKPGKQFGLQMKLLEQPGFEIEIYIHSQFIGYEVGKVRQ
jgi:hypothetical protein